jgi:hypothetical protein
MTSIVQNGTKVKRSHPSSKSYTKIRQPLIPARIALLQNDCHVGKTKQQLQLPDLERVDSRPRPYIYCTDSSDSKNNNADDSLSPFSTGRVQEINGPGETIDRLNRPHANRHPRRRRALRRLRSRAPTSAPQVSKAAGRAPTKTNSRPPARFSSGVKHRNSRRRITAGRFP